MTITWKLERASDKRKAHDWQYFNFPTTPRSEAACYFDKHSDKMWVFGGKK